MDGRRHPPTSRLQFRTAWATCTSRSNQDGELADPITGEFSETGNLPGFNSRTSSLRRSRVV